MHPFFVVRRFKAVNLRCAIKKIFMDHNLRPILNNEQAN